MTKHVEIWTLSKESRVVPYMTSELEFWEYIPYPPDQFILTDVYTDKVERRLMNIIKVSKHEKIYDKLNTDPSDLRYNTTDKYIAIHPDVEEAISVKWQEKVYNLERNLFWYKDYGRNLTGKLDDFKLLPWYKRVWKAICNNI